MRFIAFATLAAAFVTPASAAPKPSFDCAKAKTRVEKTICSSDTLADDDAAIARSFGALKRTLDPAAAEALYHDQHYFLNVRNQALDENPMFETMGARMDFLAGLMRERAQFLAAIRPRHPGDLAGKWANFDSQMEVVPAGNGTFSLSAHAVEPLRARWMCQFDGLATPQADGHAVARHVDSSTLDDGLNLEAEGVLLSVEEFQDGKTSGFQSPFCGMNGSLGGVYFPVQGS